MRTVPIGRGQPVTGSARPEEGGLCLQVRPPPKIMPGICRRRANSFAAAKLKPRAQRNLRAQAIAHWAIGLGSRGYVAPESSTHSGR